MSKEKFNQFDAFGSILKGKELPEHDKEKINSYLMLRWLSGDARTIQMSNTFNRWYSVPVNLQYDILRNSLLNKLKFIKYPKGAKEASSDSLELIKRHYNVSTEKAQEMAELISKEELKELKEIYG